MAEVGVTGVRRARRRVEGLSDLMIPPRSSRLPAASFRSNIRGGQGTAVGETKTRAGTYLSLGRAFPMSQQSPHSGTSTFSSDATSPNGLTGNGSTAGVKPLRHVLEFERPLAQLEQQIHELEA